MKEKSFRSTTLVLCLLAWLATAEAQEIRGTVSDPSGAMIAGAHLSLWSGSERIASSKTDAQGNYSLRPREQTCIACRLSCSAEGFAITTLDVTIHRGEQVALPIHLAIEVSQEILGVDGKTEPLRSQFDVGAVRQSAGKDVGEALTEIDGVYKIRKAGIANDLVVRGFQQNNVNVLIDGARIYGACPGHMDPAVQHVDFAEVERVDMALGAFDVTNSGSLGATVSVVTKTPPRGIHFTPSAAAGSFGFYNPSATASLGNDTFRTLFGYSYRVSDPYRDGSGVSFVNLKGGNYSDAAQNQRAFEIHTGWLESEFAPAENQKLTLGYTRQHSGLVLYPYLTMDSDYDNADRVSLKYEMRDVSRGIRALRAQSYFTQVIHSMNDHYRTSAMMNSWMMAANARSRAMGGRIEADAGRGFTFGLESYYRNWNMMGYMNMGAMILPNPTIPNVGTTAVGLFANYQHAITDRLHLSGGVRFDHDAMAANSGTLNTDAYYNYQNTRSTAATDNYGSGNVRMTYSLRKQLDLFAGMGTAGRVPDAEERYIRRASMTKVNVGNPNLPVVRNTESTAGLILRHDSSYIMSTLFYSRLADYILVNNQPQAHGVSGPATARSYTNVDASIYGGELSYALSLPRGFSLSGGGSYSKGSNDRKPQAGVFSSNLPEMPPLRTWASLRYVHNFLFAELGGTAVARQGLVDLDLKETPTAGYGLMHMKIGVTHHRLNASLVVDNLLNRYYYEHLSYYRDPFSAGVRVPEPGRSFFGQIKFSF